MGEELDRLIKKVGCGTGAPVPRPRARCHVVSFGGGVKGRMRSFK
jgi:hypothetical protein